MTILRKIIAGSAMVKCCVKPSSLMDYFYSQINNGILTHHSNIFGIKRIIERVLRQHFPHLSANTSNIANEHNDKKTLKKIARSLPPKIKLSLSCIIAEIS